jgi:hypothetical protein
MNNEAQPKIVRNDRVGLSLAKIRGIEGDTGKDRLGNERSLTRLREVDN